MSVSNKSSMRLLSRYVIAAVFAVQTVVVANASATADMETKASAARTVKFNFQNADLTEVISAYAKASGRKFIIDPSVRGKISIFNPQPITLESAFNDLCEALAVNGFTFTDREGTYVIQSARNSQRTLTPVVTELPPLKPERMVSMIFSLKNVSAEAINRSLRILPSKDGEMVPFGDRLMVTDYSSNLHRVAKVLAELDQPKTAAILNAQKSELQKNGGDRSEGK